MIASADGSKRRIELRRFKLLLGEIFANVFIPWMLEVELQLRPTIELDVPANQVRLEQRHAAPDVSTYELGIDDTFGYENRADRRAFARMQIRKSDCQSHSVELCGGIQLPHGFPID